MSPVIKSPVDSLNAIIIPDESSLGGVAKTQTKAHTKNLIINTFQALRYDKLIQTDIILHVLGNKRENKTRLQKNLHIKLKQLTSLLIGKATTL